MPQLKPGTTLGRWTTEEYIAKGGNGEVWQVSAPGHPKAALKLLMNNKTTSVAYQRFRREIEAVQALNGIPGVLPIIEGNLPETPKGNRAWYVMPFASSLAAELEGKDVPVVVSAVATVAETLASLHARDIRHRDIKPDNLLWLDGRPQIADFGLVSLPDAESIKDPGRIPGSMGYISDEMLANPETADAAAADVFALAKVLWKLLVPDVQFPPQGPLRADGGASNLARSLIIPTADGLDRIIESATRPEATRLTMERFASELRAWLATPMPIVLADGIAERVARAKASMRGELVERDAAAIRQREIEAAQKFLVRTAAPVIETVRAIDPAGARVGVGAVPRELRGLIEERPSLGVQQFGPPFHHGVRVSRDLGFGQAEHFVICFVVQVATDGMAVVRGLAYIGELRALDGGSEVELFESRRAPLGVGFESEISAVVAEAASVLSDFLDHFVGSGHLAARYHEVSRTRLNVDTFPDRRKRGDERRGVLHPSSASDQTAAFARAVVAAPAGLLRCLRMSLAESKGDGAAAVLNSVAPLE